MQAITIDGIHKSFKGREILTNACAIFEAGKITAVIGVNGSGKSLLFRILCGFTKPDSGEVKIAQEYMSKRRDFPEHFGVIIDRPGFVANLTGFENLKLLAKIRNVIGEMEISETMQSFGLDPSLKQKVRHYSLGMRQKLALSQAFMEAPRVLVLDEPFNALDVESVQIVRKKLLDFKQSGGTVIFTSHNEADVSALADQVFELRNGELVSI
jgi:ABC-2 type transport system ATP-binding protein